MAVFIIQIFIVLIYYYILVENNYRHQWTNIQALIKEQT
jgi:hypothetical protein